MAQEVIYIHFISHLFLFWEALVVLGKNLPCTGGHEAIRRVFPIASQSPHLGAWEGRGKQREGKGRGGEGRGGEGGGEERAGDDT